MQNGREFREEQDLLDKLGPKRCLCDRRGPRSSGWITVFLSLDEVGTRCFRELHGEAGTVSGNIVRCESISRMRWFWFRSGSEIKAVSLIDDFVTSSEGDKSLIVRHPLPTVWETGDRLRFSYLLPTIYTDGGPGEFQWSRGMRNFLISTLPASERSFADSPTLQVLANAQPRSIAGQTHRRSVSVDSELDLVDSQENLLFKLKEFGLDLQEVSRPGSSRGRHGEFRIFLRRDHPGESARGDYRGSQTHPAANEVYQPGSRELESCETSMETFHSTGSSEGGPGNRIFDSRLLWFIRSASPVARYCRLQ